VRAEGLTVVIGAGPAGCAAAVQCARLGVPVRLFDRAGRAGGLIVNGFSIENYPGLEQPLPGPVFAQRLRKHLDRFGVSVERGELIGIEPRDAAWLCRFKGADLPCASVILCAGTQPRPFRVDGDADLVRRVVFNEVRALLDAVDSPREVVVVGGGEAAFDYALTLAARGVRVTIAVRGQTPRARGRLAGMVTGHRSIRVVPETRVIGLASAGERVAARAVSPAGEESWECDAVLAAVGRQSTLADLLSPQIDDLSVQSLEPRPGLFLCGDARSGSLGQAGIAVGDGLRAARGAAERSGGPVR
jgi:thioredoxin reductase (NADPH)